jgi:putative membrane protein
MHNHSAHTTSRTALACLAVTIIVLVWSGIGPKDRVTWLMEVAPVLIALPIVLFTRKRFPLTTLLTVVITLHAIILMVGGKYTYAEMPLFNWIRDEFHLSRNHYDRVGHFMQGFGPALVIRELLLRTSSMKTGKWLATIIIFSCLGVSAIYELIEWAAAVALGEGADAFLATQGDVWDTQKDMFMAGIGAVVAVLFFSRIHDRGLAQSNEIRAKKA